MKIIVAGSRVFKDYSFLCSKLDRLLAKFPKAIILSGAAGGADSLGEKWALSHWHTVERYHADWDRHGRSAGVIRNQEMVDEADRAIFFHVGNSPGTKDCIQRCKAKAIKIKVYKFKE